MAGEQGDGNRVAKELCSSYPSKKWVGEDTVSVPWAQPCGFDVNFHVGIGYQPVVPDTPII